MPCPTVSSGDRTSPGTGARPTWYRRAPTILFVHATIALGGCPAAGGSHVPVNEAGAGGKSSPVNTVSPADDEANDGSDGSIPPSRTPTTLPAPAPFAAIGPPCAAHSPSGSPISCALWAATGPPSATAGGVLRGTASSSSATLGSTAATLGSARSAAICACVSFAANPAVAMR